MKTSWECVEFFENLVAEFSGSKYGVAVDSCTNAIFLCLRYLDLKCQLDIPKRTFLSVPIMAKHAGYGINFVDQSWSGCYQLWPSQIVDSAQRFTKGMYIRDTFYCLSFNNKKTLPIGKGGMILCDDKIAVDWLKAARFLGRSILSYNNINNLNCNILGWNMYMTPEQAARGIELFYGVNSNNADTSRSSNYNVDLSTLNIFK